MREYGAMDRSSQDSPAVEGILGSPNPVVLLRGPAGSGKTSAVLEIYRRSSDESLAPACLLIVPNASAAEGTRARLLDQSDSGVLVSPQILTFIGLAGRILASAGGPAKTISAFRRRLLLREILDDLNRTGHLKALASVADTPGVVVSLDRSIAELKRAAVEPDRLAAAIDPGDARSADLLAVYRRYQEALHAEGAFDLEGRMWLARDVLAGQIDEAADLPAMRGVSVVAVDGFTDFTPTQLEMLALLSRRVERVVITLPHAEDGRERMWRWTGKTLERIRQAFGERMALIDLEARPARGSPIWDSVFKTDGDVASPGEGMELVAAPGPEDEVAAAARRIKKLLLGGARAGGIAVLARSMDSYRPIIERIFSGCNIPVAAAPTPLNDVPIVRYVFDVASLAPEFASRNVLRITGSSYFRPEALGPYGRDEVAAADMLIRNCNVLAGRDSYRQALDAWCQGQAAERMAAGPGKTGDDDETMLGTLSVARELIESSHQMLTRLFDLGEQAKDPAGLLSAAGGLELRQAAQASGRDDLIARDLRALELLEASLGELPDSVALPQAAEALSAALCPAARGESLVAALDVLDARSLRFDHVFLLGLSEGQFPPKFAESSLIREADRQSWRQRGVELYRRGDLTAREMLLFYLAASRADQTLTLSFLESGPLGEASQAGPFLLAAMAPFGGLAEVEGRGLVERIGPGTFVPPTDRIACPPDAVNAAISGVFQPGQADRSAALGWAARFARDKIDRAARGLLARHRRHTFGQCDRFDGRVSHPKLLAGLAARYPGATVFSPRTLNSFGQCPWQFFASEVLKLQPLREPQRRLEPVTRGLFAHDVLFRTMSDLSGRAGGPLRLADVQESDLLAALDRAVEAAAAELEKTGVAYPALWQIQTRQMRRDLAGYLLDQQKKAAGSVQLHFELGFGLTDAPQESADAASVDEPIALATPAGEIKIRGRIDRVDRLDAGEGELFIVDYKTGRLPTGADVDRGRALQLPIYAEAAEQILHLPSAGGAFHGLRDSVERHFSAIKPARGDKRPLAERRKAVAGTIANFVQAMAAGRFDALPTHDCPHYCPLRQICQFSPARAELKLPYAERQQEDRSPYR